MGAAPSIPLSEWLLPGQAMLAEEFLSRWNRMPELKQAELIDGIVYMPSPVSQAHGDIDAAISGWLNRFAFACPKVRVAANTTFVFNDRNVAQPDQSLRLLPEFGGRCQLAGKLLHGAPELVVEIAYSSADRDLGVKKAIYQRAGVDEYLVVDLLAAEIHWLHRAGDDPASTYVPLLPDASGIIRSVRFPGLWLDVAALWRLDLAQVARAADAGLQSPEFAAFRQATA